MEDFSFIVNLFLIGKHIRYLISEISYSVLSMLRLLRRTRTGASDNTLHGNTIYTSTLFTPELMMIQLTASSIL